MDFCSAMTWAQSGGQPLSNFSNADGGHFSHPISALHAIRSNAGPGSYAYVGKEE
jgi:hypothetical protein